MPFLNRRETEGAEFVWRRWFRCQRSLGVLRAVVVDQKTLVLVPNVRHFGDEWDMGCVFDESGTWSSKVGHEVRSSASCRCLFETQRDGERRVRMAVVAPLPEETLCPSCRGGSKVLSAMSGCEVHPMGHFRPQWDTFPPSAWRAAKSPGKRRWGLCAAGFSC